MYRQFWLNTLCSFGDLVSAIYFLFACGLLGSLLSCHISEERFTLVNSSEHTITFYLSKTVSVTNKELFDRFKNGDDSSDTIPWHLIKILPNTSFYDYGYPRFASQFRTKDGLFHMLILDVDSVTEMTKKNKADSGIIKSIVLQQFSYTKTQLEKDKRKILYHGSKN